MSCSASAPSSNLVSKQGLSKGFTRPILCQPLLQQHWRCVQVRTNWVGLIDEWATRFFHELDYEREAENGMTFKQQMVALEGIVVADVYQQLTNKEVLTTTWVQGISLIDFVLPSCT